MSQSHTITFSMNGFRRNLSDDVAELRDLVKDVLAGEHYDFDDLRNAMNQVICSSNSLNCVLVAGDENFTDLSDLELELIDDATDSEGDE